MNESNTASPSICFKSLAKNVLKEAAKDYNEEKKFTPQILLKLRWTFGSTFERALELFEGNKVSIFTTESTRHVNNDKCAYSFCEVKGQSSEVYTIFPHVNFCSCLAFENQVIRDKNSFTCKHVLAVWLAIISSNGRSSQFFPELKFCELLEGRVLD